MEVSIVIVNYNSEDYTFKCVESIIENVNNCSYEVIIVDNNSDNFNADSFLNLEADIKIYGSEENVGFSKGNNLGVQMAKGDVILLLNNDTELVNDAVSICLEKLNSDKTGVVGAKLLYKDKSYQPSAFPFPTIVEQLVVLFRLNKLNFVPGFLKKHWSLRESSKPVLVDWVSGAFFMFRKSDLDQFPGRQLQTDFFMYCEDIQWSYYFKKKLGKQVLYCPEAQVIHHIGKSMPLDMFQKRLKFYFPNLQKLLVKEKGWIYAKFFLFFLILRYWSDLRNISFNKKVLPLIKLWLGTKKSKNDSQKDSELITTV